MRIQNLIVFSCFTFLIITSCQQTTTSEEESGGKDDHHLDSGIQAPETVKLKYGEVDTAKISQWLTSAILKEDLNFLNAEQRSYQLDAYDLNNDGSLEYFIGFTNDYFCGSGGCTYYLLSHEGDIISLFSVSRAPFYVLPSRTNGWSDLAINSNSGMRKLMFDGTSYPPNPADLPAFDDSIQSTDTTTVLKDAQTYSF